MTWALRKILYRFLHGVMGMVIRSLNFPVPSLSKGQGCVRELPNLAQEKGLKDLLLVTDHGITGIGLHDRLVEGLGNADIRCTVFDAVQPNPSIQDIEAGLNAYLSNRCDGIIAFGGGSSMDCAKMIGARVSNPDKSVLDMRGAFKIPKKLPPLFAVPTTAGTGSECTIAAVVTDPDMLEKFAVASFKLTPLHATLDPELMIGLPPQITAATGMDALTHAVEAYIGRWGTRFTNAKAESAVKTIFQDLEAVYGDGSDVTRRNNMALASYDAGLAFNRAMVGYVHAIAHNLGGMYGVPHGLANAIVLPYILDFCRKDCEKKLARLSIITGIGVPNESEETLSRRFVERIREMNHSMDIPAKVEKLQLKDIPLIAERALREGNPGYPVPKLMNQSQCETLLRQLLVGESESFSYN